MASAYGMAALSQYLTLSSMSSVALNDAMTVPTSCWSADRFIILPPMRCIDFILAVLVLVLLLE